MNYRKEHDSMGDVSVPADRYWGAQTQRSLENFPIGTEKMPVEIVRAFGLLKKAAALANRELRPAKMTEEKCAAICAACDEVANGQLDAHFPLAVWQTGSGTQSNMNANEVIANRANILAAGLSSAEQIPDVPRLCHPNDDVNMSQSSNDTFPTAMHVAGVLSIRRQLIPALGDRHPEPRMDAGRSHYRDGAGSVDDNPTQTVFPLSAHRSSRSIP